MTTQQSCSVATEAAHFSVAGEFLDAISTQDFGRLKPLLREDATLQALLPRRVAEWAGPEEIADTFAEWLGHTKSYQLVGAEIGEVAGCLHMRWRARVRTERLGPGWFLVEQQVYADTDDSGRIGRLRLLCSGYRKEHQTSLPINQPA
jgi:hypothetical protein